MTRPALGRSFAFALVGAFLAMTTLLGVIAALALYLLAGPKPQRFANPFFEFRLPHGWQCAADGTEHVCRNAISEDKAKQAIVILAMKHRGPSDTFEKYAAHLRTPQMLDHDRLKEEAAGAAHVKNMRASEVRMVGRRFIGRQEWVESLHLASEVPNYLTHYLATTTSTFSVLITFSAHQRFYDDYKPDIDALAASLVMYQAAARR